MHEYRRDGLCDRLIGWCVVFLFVIAFACLVMAFVSWRAEAQDSAVDIFRAAQDGTNDLATKDDQQDWTAYWLCREIDRLHDAISELRGQLWKLALLVGGGGAVGGAGAAFGIRKKRNGGG